MGTAEVNIEKDYGVPETRLLCPTSPRPEVARFLSFSLDFLLSSWLRRHPIVYMCVSVDNNQLASLAIGPFVAAPWVLGSSLLLCLRVSQPSSGADSPYPAGSGTAKLPCKKSKIFCNWDFVIISIVNSYFPTSHMRNKRIYIVVKYLKFSFLEC